MPVLDFLKNIPHDILNAGEGVVRTGLNIGSQFGNELGALGETVVGNQQAAQDILRPGGGLGHQGGILGGAELGPGAVFANPENIKKTVGFGAEAASFGIAPETKTLSFLKGATAGATAGAVGTAGSQLAQGQPLDPTQIAEGGLLGGALGGAVSGVTKFISDAKASKLAKLDDTKAITKELTPDIGPILADRVAPAVATAKDPSIIQNMVGNEVHRVTPEPETALAPPQEGPIAPTEQPTGAVGKNISGGVGKVYRGTASELTPERQAFLKTKGYTEFVNSSGKKIGAEKTIDTLNPTGGLFVDYTPKERATMPLGKNITTLAETSGKPANEMVTIYRGAPKNQKSIVAGDFVTTSKDSAKSYTGDGNVIETKVPASHILDDRTEPLGGDYIYRPTPSIGVGKNVGGEKPFLNPPNTEKPQPTHISALDARQSAADILNQGGTVDEAMNEFFTKGGMNLGEAKQAMHELMQPGGAGIVDRSKVNASLNPQYDKVADNFGTAKLGDNERPVLNSQVAHNQVMRLGNSALEEMDKLKPEDLKLVDYLANSDPKEIVAQASDKVQMQKVIDTLKTYNDYTQAAGAHLGQDIPYRQNYGVRRQYDPSPEGQAAMQAAKAKLAQSPGYTKGQFFKNYDEAAQFGLQRANENAMQDLASDMNQRSSNLSQLSLAKSLEESYPGQIKTINSGNIPNGYKQLTIPGGDKFFAPESVASEINKRVRPDEATGFWKGYDTINSNLKNLKLAGGGFHSVNVLGSYLGQQIASGKIFTPTGARDLGTVIKGTFSDNAYKSELDRLGQSGKLIDADASGLVYSMGRVQADVGRATGIVGKIPILNSIHDAIFGRQIPLLKLKIFEQKTEGLSRNDPVQLEQMTKIAKELNQNFGGINQAIQGLTPKQFKVASRLFLATDYNEGQLMSLRDAFTKGGAEGKLAREVVFGKALLFGGLATAGAVAGGDFANKKPSEVAFDLLHKIVNPKFQIGGYNVGLPTTQVAEVAKPLEDTVKGVQSGHNLQGIQNFATSRLAAVPSEGLQLAGNKNYAGQNIYGVDSHGRPISPATTAADVAGTVLPIPFKQTVQTATGEQSLAAGAANVAGLRVTPQYDASRLPVGQQTYLQREQLSGAPKEKIDADTSFFSIIQQNSTARKNASSAITKDISKGDMQKAQADATAYNQNLIRALQPWLQTNKQYMDSTLYGQLTSSPMAPATGLGLLRVSGIRYRQQDIKRNPTKYGQSITPLNLP